MSKHILIIVMLTIITAILYMKAYYLLSFAALTTGVYLTYMFDTKIFSFSDNFVFSIIAIVFLSGIVLFIPPFFPFYTDVLQGIFAIVIGALIKNFFLWKGRKDV